MSQDVLIIGASARAAACSAVRGVFRPVCVDQFADRDLAALCPVARVPREDIPGGFAKAAEALPPMPWFYTGGIENQPDLVDRISRRHRLWGVGAAALRRVRDPSIVAEVLTEARIPVPEVRRKPAGLPRDGSWLIKPVASGGGIGVEPLRGAETSNLDGVYFQRRISGPSFSALFIGARGRSRLVGVVRQWIGGVPGRPFAYRGGIGPWPAEAALAKQLDALGDCLADAFELVGWFGVDYVLRDGIPWPVEVNPRYTASIEIHERASGWSLLPEHRDACEGGSGSGPGRDGGLGRPGRVVAKWVVYAPCPLVLNEAVWRESWEHDLDEVVADIPAPGVSIEAGDPVMTLIAIDSDSRRCQARLRRFRRAWAARLQIRDG